MKKIPTLFMILAICICTTGCPTPPEKPNGNGNGNGEVTPPVEKKPDDQAAVSALQEAEAELTESDGNVTGVKIVGKKISNDTLAHLKGLPHLEILEISSPDINDEGMPHIGALTSLKRLRLAECSSITDVGIKHWSTLENLEEANLTRVSIRDDGLEWCNL